MSDGPTTARARRQQAVAEGDVATAVDRLSGGSNPGGNDPETTSRERQRRTKQDIAEELDISREGVGSVDRLDGLDVFLRSSGVDEFGNDVASDFASEADYVQPADVDPNVDGQAISASPVVASGRRDDVAQRTRQALAGDDQFARASDFGVDVGPRGVESAGLTDSGERRRAGRFFESKTPLSEVDPTADLTQSGDGFALDTAAERRSAARGFESNTDLFNSGDLDPTTDLRQTDSGFGLARDEARQVAAARIDEQVSEVNVSPSDITLEETASGEFEASFETEVRR
jgi:hypothetical protein